MSMRSTTGMATISLKFFLCIMTVSMFMINGCSQSNNHKEGTVSNDVLSAPLPDLFATLALEETNLLVEVIDNGGAPQTCRNLKVDTTTNTYSCEITLSEGSHTLSLVYSVIDATYGKIQLVSTAGININITGGQSTPADFSTVALSNADDDRDGISNLDELNEGSDPTESSYYVGGSVIGLLGSGAVLQLNGANDLILSSNDSVNFVPAIADKSTYTVTVLTQPNNPNQTCTVANGGGIVSGAQVNDVTVTCVNNSSDVAVALTAPLANSTLASNVNITWNNLNPSPTRVKILLSEDGGTNFDVEVATVLNTGSFTWNTLSLQDSSTYRIRLLAIDENGIEGGKASESTGNFTIDNTAPVVTVTSPGNGQIVQGLITNVTWVTADANPNLITIQLSDNSGQSFNFDLVSGVVDTGIYEFNTTTFPDGTNYKIQIVSTDSAGNVSQPALSSGNFTIQNSGPIQGPQVSGTVLFQDINFNNLVDANDTLIVPFSQSIQISNVQASDFNLPKAGDSLGSQPAFNIGTAPHELVITLGQNAKLTIKVDSLGNGSRVDVSSTMALGAITTNDGLISAQSSMPVDIFPSYVESSLLRVCPTSDISIGDVNNDGFADIAQVCDDSTIGTIIHINDKSGNFTEGPQLAPNLANGVELADLNNDGFLDIVEINRAAASGSTHKASVIYLNDKNGGFTFHQNLGLDSTTAYGLAVGDIDNDQDLDIIIGRYNLPSFVYINDGAATFSKHAIEIPATKITQVYLQHINNDSFLDLIIAGHNKFDHIIYTGNGDGSFTERQRISNPGGAYMAFEKLNNDAFVDIVLAVSGLANQVFYNDGNGSFLDAGKPFGTSSSFGIALIDIDGDSDFDIVEGTDFNAPGLVWINSGTEIFIDSGARLANRQTRGMDAGDLDNDGDIDIVLGNAYQNSGIWKASYATP